MRALLLITLLVSSLAASAESAVDQSAPQPSAPEGSPTGAAAPAPTGVLTKAPVLKQFVDAPYPAEAQAAKLEGTVTLEIEIGADGKVSNPVVVVPAGHGFDEAALAAVAQFEFEPAEIDNLPSPVRVTYQYAFVYRPPPEPEKSASEAAPTHQAAHVVVFEGRALERGTRVPLKGATVLVEREGETREATCDDEGRFQFEDLPPGTWKVGVRQERFEPYDTSEEIRAGEVTSAKYYVRRKVEGFEVTVRGKREQKDVARRTLTLAEIQKIPGTQGDAIRVVQNLPGVARTPLGFGPLVVRGGRSGDTRTYIDAQLVPLLFHFGGLTSVINSEFLESLDFYPGNYPVRFGRSISGAVDVNTRAGRTDRYRGYANLNLFDSTLFLEGPLTSKGSFMASVRRSYVDAILPLVTRFVSNADAVNFSVAPRYWDYQFKTDFDLGRDKLSFFVYGSDDQLSFALANPSAFTTESRGTFFTSIGFHRLTARWERKLLPTLTSRLSTTIGTDLTKNSIGKDIYIDVQFDTWTLREDLSWKPLDWLTFDGGLDFLGAKFTYGVQAPPLPIPGQTFNPNLNGQLAYASDTGIAVEPALYLDAVVRPLPGLKLVPGIRVDYEQYIGRVWFDPRFAAFYELTPKLMLKASAGLYHQPPTPEKLTKKFGNPNLTEEASVQYAAGLEYKFLDRWDLDLQGYYKNLYAEATASNQLVTAAQQSAFGAVPFRNTGRGYAYGAELLLRRAPSDGLFGWLAVSLGQAWRQAAPGEPYVQSALAQRYNITGVVSYKVAKWDMDFGVRMRLTDGNPYTTYVGHIYDVDSDNMLGIPSLNRRSERRPPFFQMDVRVDKQWVFEKWILNAYLDLLNATYRQNREGESWNYDFTAYKPVTGLPIFPAFGIKGEF